MTEPMGRRRARGRWTAPLHGATLAFAVAFAVFTLAACDVKKIAELEVGVTTEAELRTQWGEPAAVYTEPDGSRTLEYTRQPAGQVNYMMALGADGKLVAMRQVLKPVNFAKVEAGWDKSQVRRLLGAPAKTQRYALKNEEVWDWRFADGSENKVFSVTFDGSGRVTASATTSDPQDAGQRG